MQIYINKNNQQSGPYEEEKILEMLKSGQLSPDDSAIRHGEQQWQKLAQMFPQQAAIPPIASSAVQKTPKKSRKGLLLGCGGFLLALFLIGGVLGFLAYRNLFPSGTAVNLPETIGDFKIEDPKDLSTPKGDVWGTSKKYVTKYKRSADNYALIVLDEYPSAAAAETEYSKLPSSNWCKGEDPLYISYQKDGKETSNVTYCTTFFVKHENQIFNVISMSKSGMVDDYKNILDNLPFNVGATGQSKD